MKKARTKYGFEVELSDPVIKLSDGFLQVDAQASTSCGSCYRLRVGRSDGPSFINTDGEEIYDIGTTVIICTAEGEVKYMQTAMEVPSFTLKELSQQSS